MTLLPTVLCRGWRSSLGRAIPCHAPVMQQGDEGGRIEAGWQCSLCAALERQACEAKYRREGRELLQRRAKGYGGPAPGEDIWRGFREGD